MREGERGRERGVFTQLKSCLLSDGTRTDIPKLFALDNEQPQSLRGFADPKIYSQKKMHCKAQPAPQHSGIRISLNCTAASGIAMVTRERKSQGLHYA